MTCDWRIIFLFSITTRSSTYISLIINFYFYSLALSLSLSLSIFLSFFLLPFFSISLFLCSSLYSSFPSSFSFASLSSFSLRSCSSFSAFLSSASFFQVARFALHCSVIGLTVGITCKESTITGTRTDGRTDEQSSLMGYDKHKKYARNSYYEFKRLDVQTYMLVIHPYA